MSSHTIKSTSANIRMLRNVISAKLPIGVATIYIIPLPAAGVAIAARSLVAISLIAVNHDGDDGDEDEDAGVGNDGTAVARARDVAVDDVLSLLERDAGEVAFLETFFVDLVAIHRNDDIIDDDITHDDNGNNDDDANDVRASSGW